MSDKQHYSLELAMKHMERALKIGSRPLRLTIRKFNPGGLTAHQTTEVESMHVGSDWQAGQMVIFPAKPLTELSPEDVAAITKSVREGGSWHAYKAQERLRNRIAELEAELRRLRAEASPIRNQP